MALKPLNVRGLRKQQVRRDFDKMELAAARVGARPPNFKIKLAPLPKSAIPKIKSRFR